MNLNEYKLVDTGKVNLNYVCEICYDCESQEKLTKLKCNHVFHENCIKKHIEIKVENKSEIIKCPLEKCNVKIEDNVIIKFLNDKGINDYKINKITYDENYCMCKKCNKTYCKKNENSFIEYCNVCETRQCFQCGKDHMGNVNCFEADIEMKELIDNFYKDKDIELRMCTHCNLPQEKLSGCDYMICGKNKHDKKMSIQGCGKNFEWKDAKKYKPYATHCFNTENDNLEITNMNNRNDMNVMNDMNNMNVMNDMNNMTECIKMILYIILFIILLTTTIYSVVMRDKILIKNKEIRDDYCHTKFEYVDKNFINYECLKNNNYTVEDYKTCEKDLFCWNYGDNIYTKTCTDDEAKYYEKMCNKYKSYYQSPSCDEKENEEIYACKKGRTLYIVIANMISIALCIIFLVICFVHSTS